MRLRKQMITRSELDGGRGSWAPHPWPLGAPLARLDRRPTDGLVAGLRGPKLGWSEGRNVRIDLRWGDGGQAQVHKSALELVELSPDVIVAPGSAAAGPALLPGRGASPARPAR
jgi:hypothetical protein